MVEIQYSIVGISIVVRVLCVVCCVHKVDDCLIVVVFCWFGTVSVVVVNFAPSITTYHIGMCPLCHSRADRTPSKRS